MSGGRQLAVLAAAGRELERLASIEAAISDPSNFARDRRVVFFPFYRHSLSDTGTLLVPVPSTELQLLVRT
jgi:hypothetical protein